MFVIAQESTGGEFTFMCHASGSVGMYLSNKMRPKDCVHGTGYLVKTDDKIIVQIKTLYLTVPGWGRENIKPKKKTAKKSILYNPK